MSDTSMNASDIDQPNFQQQRWYRNSTQDPPFQLSLGYSSDKDSNPLSTAAIFPWSQQSLEELWNGDLNKEEFFTPWKEMVLEWSGVCAVGGVGKVLVYGLGPSFKPIRIRLPAQENPVACNVAWALARDESLEPLLVISNTKILHVFNVKTRQVISNIRGHGGAITSIAVHPTHPCIFCSTSRDFSTRIYDLSLQPTQENEVTNPHWPPDNTPSLSGAPHGLQMTESEGYGIGRCVAVLAGGRAGGHLAAVLCAAFHPGLPLVATGGVDRFVKIWRLPDLEGTSISREDKPLFSSSQIHKARVLSVSWLGDDTLMSHSAPALMRRKSDDINDIYEEKGTLAIWHWLSLNRFFPPNMKYQRILRGCASDYQESASFKLISIYSLPSETRDLQVYRSPTHDPVIIVPSDDALSLCLSNVTHLQPRFVSGPPPFPLDVDEEDMAQAMVDQDSMVQAMEMTNLSGDNVQKEKKLVSVASSPMLPSEWQLRRRDGSMGSDERILACKMGVGGAVIVAVGERGSVWIWVAERSPSPSRSV